MLRIQPGTEARYDQLHEEMPIVIRRAIESSGLAHYTLFRSGLDVVGYVEATPDLETCMAKLNADPSFLEWAADFDGVFAESMGNVARLVILEEIWHVD